MNAKNLQVSKCEKNTKNFRHSRKNHLRGIGVESRCQKGEYGCKYCGDLDEICPKYQRFTEDGEPITTKDFPLHCKDCECRDFNFCLFYTDLICFNEQDPFNCKADLTNDKLYGIELSEKCNEATKKAFLKRNLPYKGPHI